MHAAAERPVTGERTAETYSWTVSSGAKKVNSVKGAEGGRKSAVSGCGVWVVHSTGTCQTKKRVFDYGQLYAATVMLDLHPWW